MQKVSILSLTFLFSIFSSAQEQLTLTDTDRLLIKNNLELLVAQYNINIAEAQKTQAKLFSNPELSVQIPAYSKQEGWLDLKKDIDISLQQAVQIAGKRKAGIQLAEGQKELALQQYELLAKQLKYAVHNSFFTIYYLKQSIDKTHLEISKIKNIIDALKIQYNKGNITLNELIRVTASYNSLSNSILELQNSIDEEKSNLKTLLLLSPDSDFILSPTSSELDKYSLDFINLSDVLAKAEEQQPQIKLAEAAIRLNKMQLKYEKKQALPDLQFGAGYSKSGEYVPNAVYFSAGIAIPLFNRNQGNIKTAEYQLKQAQTDKELQQNILKNKIVWDFGKIKAILERNSGIDPDFEKQFDALMTHVSENYMKRNISLLEFTDLIETYHEQIVQLNHLKLQQIMAYEDLDYDTGYNLFN
ncbi:MAG: TolC family protein [Tannerella sp.]|jgi:cobalt-zinc-cadmium efflux system outer membrane protein|nr:TolC family protein [Tannerella sp.]